MNFSHGVDAMVNETTSATFDVSAFQQEDVRTLHPLEISSLTDTHEKILTLLPIVPCFLSVMGSGSILHFILRDKKHSPFRRILFAMSACDILSSIVWACQAWLVPKETSQWVWAVGNDATCTVMGTLQQFSFSNYWYAGMLSYYFLMIVRFGWRERFAKQVEPMVHFLSIGYPLVTAIAGAIMGIYHELDVGPGCWINKYPENCGNRPWESGEQCLSPLYAYMFAAIPVILMILSCMINHMVIYCYVRKTNLRTSTTNLRGSAASRRQSRAVATQGFLYVSAFLVCYIWPIVVRALEAYVLSESHQHTIFPLLCLQSFLMPAQGFFNLAVFLRPRVHIVQGDFPNETWLWAVRRALFGESVQPKNCNHRDPTTGSFSARTHADDNSNRPSSILNRSVQACKSVFHSKNNHYNSSTTAAAAESHHNATSSRLDLLPEDVSTAFFMTTDNRELRNPPSNTNDETNDETIF